MNKKLYLLSLFLLFTLSIFCYAQDSEDKSKIEQIEFKLMALEDYIKLELKELKQELERKNATVNILQKQNKELSETVSQLKKVVQQLEKQMLREQINKQDFSNTEATEVAEEKSTIETTNFQNEKIKNIAEKMSSKDMNIRMAAVLDLSKIEDKEAFDVFKMALKDRDSYIKILTCKVLARKKNKTLCSDLLKLLNDKNRDVRKHAGNALEEITNISVAFNPNDQKDVRDKKIAEWQTKINSMKE